MIYLDYASTTPMSPLAIEVYSNVAARFYGNTSSLHDIGSSGAQVVEASRKAIANLFHAEERGVFFTGGGSDSNALAIQSLVKGHSDRGRHLITSQVEHSSVTNVFKKLEAEGFDVTYLGVDEFGLIALSELEAHLRPDTMLVSIQHANSETGIIQPVEHIGTLLKEKQILFHSDCVQTFGKIPLSARWFDSCSISAHKLYGPKGVGAVYLQPHSNWASIQPGTTQEKGLRPGTLNTPGIAAFATAAKELSQEQEAEYNRYRELRAYTIKQLKTLEFEVEIQGHEEHQLPHILGLRFPGMEGQFFMLECSQAGVAIATGSACQTGQQMPSGVQLALGKSTQEAREFVRLSFGKQTTTEQIDQVIPKFDTILSRHFQKVKL
ncbi:MAG: IscS subfamily cysteine desulfurase [Bacteroidota bacterium]